MSEVTPISESEWFDYDVFVLHGAGASDRVQVLARRLRKGGLKVLLPQDDSAEHPSRLESLNVGLARARHIAMWLDEPLLADLSGHHLDALSLARREGRLVVPIVVETRIDDQRLGTLTAADKRIGLQSISQIVTGGRDPDDDAVRAWLTFCSLTKQGPRARSRWADYGHGLDRRGE